jgi:hypothetical protein
VAAAAVPGAHRTGPPPGHTGGFGEPLCAVCHFDAILDDPAGSLEIVAPASYQPGAGYDLVVRLRHPELRAAGFQLSARFADGPRAGRQAGTLGATGPDVRVFSAETGVAYASHTAAGTAPADAGTARWQLRWIAPDPAGRVIFHAAANAANDDDSEYGDRVYSAAGTIDPEK